MAVICCPQTSGSDECQLTREAAPPSVSPVHTVYVGNLAVTVNERHLWDAFGVCGRIRSLQVSARMLGTPICSCSSKAQPRFGSPLRIAYEFAARWQKSCDACSSVRECCCCCCPQSRAFNTRTLWPDVRCLR